MRMGAQRAVKPASAAAAVARGCAAALMPLAMSCRMSLRNSSTLTPRNCAHGITAEHI